MGMSVGELFVSLGFDVDDGKLKAFNESIKTASGELLKLSAIATGGLYALNAFLEGSVSRAFGIKNFATETGQASEGLQRFQSVVNQVNASISTSEAASKYRALADAMTDITQQGGGGALARLTGGAFHIGMREEEVIEAIRNYKQQFIAENGGGQIGVAAHARLLDQIGVGAGSERAFDLSKEEYFARSDPFVRSQQTIDATAKLGDAIALAQQRWDKFKDELVADWSGPLIRALQAASDWLKDFGRSVEAIIGVWRTWPDVIKDASVVLLAVLAIWAAPFGATLAVVTAIAAAIWDIGRAIRGLPSVTGSFLDTESKGLKLLFHDPAKFGNNILSTVDDLLGVDRKNPQLNWLGNSSTNSGNQVTQNVTAHIFTKADADDLVNAFMKQNQAHLNTTIMSLIGRPAY